VPGTPLGQPLGAGAIETLVRPYLLDGTVVPGGVYEQLARYLELLLKWNARTNLSAVREPEEMVQRHFGESLFAAQCLAAREGPQGRAACGTLLDFGSGAGFPGLPIQLMRPETRVTLAESQNKKAAFLREAVRTLGLATEVWADRVEAMPAGRRFDVVALRAVDRMDLAVAAAAPRADRGLLLMTTAEQPVPEVTGFRAEWSVAVPGSEARQIVFLERVG
jgi:16S rRNA (guanine527-N7)-methyltransferase